jgi:hypothetical protein
MEKSRILRPEAFSIHKRKSLPPRQQRCGICCVTQRGPKTQVSLAIPTNWKVLISKEKGASTDFIFDHFIIYLARVTYIRIGFPSSCGQMPTVLDGLC